jgi:hypothetical protein
VLPKHEINSAAALIRLDSAVELTEKDKALFEATQVDDVTSKQISLETVVPPPSCPEPAAVMPPKQQKSTPIKSLTAYEVENTNLEEMPDSFDKNDSSVDRPSPITEYVEIS